MPPVLIKIDRPTEGSRVAANLGRIDPSWRKARIAARILLKPDRGLPFSLRDYRLSKQLQNDPAVTNRLVDQAVHFTRARQNGFRLMA